MNRLKLIGAALLLVIFDTYTASADPKSSAPTGSVESVVDGGTASVIALANDVVVITTPVQTSSGEVAVIQRVVMPQ